MTTIIKNLIGEKLLNTHNDINICDMIMEYLLIECECCDKKLVRGDLTLVYCECDTEKLLCEKCLTKSACTLCGSFIDDCETCNTISKAWNMDIEDKIFVCGDSHCDSEAIYCGDCRDSDMHNCDFCEFSFCCRDIYRFDRDTFCIRCVKDSLIHKANW